MARRGRLIVFVAACVWFAAKMLTVNYWLCLQAVWDRSIPTDVALDCNARIGIGGTLVLVVLALGVGWKAGYVDLPPSSPSDPSLSQPDAVHEDE